MPVFCSRDAILWFALTLLCLKPFPAEGQMSRLEAVHMAEILTGGVVQACERVEDAPDRPYQLHGEAQGSSFRMRVHATHGRVLSIDRQIASRWQRAYQWPGIRVVAHRGGALLGPPENTIEAIEKAIEIGADLIEIDIRQTKDGHLILMHDVTVDRTTHGHGKVSDLTLAQIRQLEVKNPTESRIQVPTLREALKVMKGRIDPDLDYKEGDLGKLLEVVRELDMVEACTLYGSWERCEQMAAEEPRLRIRPSADFPLQVPTVARTLRPAMVNFDWHAVSEEGIRLAHSHGCLAFVNCLGRADTETYMQWAVEAGADYIQSDRPDRVVAYLKQKGLYRLHSGEPGQLKTPLRSIFLQYPFR